MYESNHKENKSTLQCTVHLYSLLIDYLMADFKHSQIRQLGAEIESISLLCLNAHCHVKFLCADLRFGLLRLSTMKKCPHMLRLDHRGLRNMVIVIIVVVVVEVFAIAVVVEGPLV